jgi:hypothetical protein
VAFDAFTMCPTFSNAVADWSVITSSLRSLNRRLTAWTHTVEHRVELKVPVCQLLGRLRQTCFPLVLHRNLLLLLPVNTTTGNFAALRLATLFINLLLRRRGLVVQKWSIINIHQVASESWCRPVQDEER